MKQTCLYGGPVFDGIRQIPEGNVLFTERAILSVADGGDLPKADVYIDVQGAHIVPGLVDLHSDTLEKCIEMRPGVYFDGEFALKALDKRLPACGITTFCHAVSFGDDEIGLRSGGESEKIIHLIQKFRNSSQASVNHKIHARCEISSKQGAGTVTRLLETGLLDMVSVMDHSPGQGQFRELEAFQHYYKNVYSLTDSEVAELADRKKEFRGQGWQDVNELITLALDKQIPVLSHDDDTAEKIKLLSDLGVTASEFPVSLSAAEKAKEEKMKVFMGAPNFFRGASSNGHISARDMVERDLCDGLVSDYYPECMLQTPFVANSRLDMKIADGLRLVTSGPGDFLPGEGHAGYLTEGSPADIIVISVSHTLPEITQTWVNGQCVFMTKVKAA